MRTPLATLTLTALLSLPGLASADVYKCTDPAGRVHYQNMSCTGADAPAIVSPGPGSTYTGPVRAMHAAPEAPTRPRTTPDVRRAAAANPVDTRAFGMLPIGASERDVHAKLGPPDRVIEVARTLVLNRWSSGRREWREKVRSAWVYDSDGYTMRTVLSFEDGQLVQKEKGR